MHDFLLGAAYGLILLALVIAVVGAALSGLALWRIARTNTSVQEMDRKASNTFSHYATHINRIDAVTQEHGQRLEVIEDELDGVGPGAPTVH